jgi:hypothetical protein
MINRTFTTVAAAIIGTASLLAVSASAQAQTTPQARYHSPTNPYGYEYGYQPGATATTVGSISPRDQAGPAPQESWISYCSAKYRTYDRVSNTFWGKDGKQHICRGF